MTTLHLCTSQSWGGLELYAATLMAELRDAGCGVVAVCTPGSAVGKFLSGRHVECVHLPIRSKISPRSARFLLDIIDSRRVDAVHVHFHHDVWNAVLALRSRPDVRLLVGIYMGVISKNDILHRWLYGRVDAFLTSSERLNRILPERYPVDPSVIQFLPYGRRLDLYHRNEPARVSLRRELGVGPDEVLVGSVVRIDPGKGVLDFAKSFSYLDSRFPVHYLIAGEPTRKARSEPGDSPYEERCLAYRSEIERFVGDHALGEKIHMIGYRDDLIGTLSALDMFVFPSRDELYSLVMLDAMAMGLPIVAAKAGGNLDQITDGVSGLLYEVGDSRALAGKLNRYLESPETARRAGEAARAFVEERHSMDATIRRLLGLYATPRIST